MTYFAPSADRKGSRLHFKKSESEKVEYIDYIVHLFENAQHYNNSSQQVLEATGGGAHLFHNRFASRLPNVIVDKEDEMECLIIGK